MISLGDSAGVSGVRRQAPPRLVGARIGESGAAELIHGKKPDTRRFRKAIAHNKRHEAGTATPSPPPAKEQGPTSLLRNAINKKETQIGARGAIRFNEAI